MKRILSLTALLLVIASSAFADIAQPDRTPKPTPTPRSVTTSMRIRLDRNATEAKLILPKSQIKQLRAELEQLDSESDDTAVVTNTSRTQTIVSGAFLSLALVFGGMWFVRSGKSATKSGKSLMILAIVAGVGSAATLVYANAGPPPITSITGNIFNRDAIRYRSINAPVKIEMSDDNSVQFIVPDPQPATTPSSEE